MATRTYTLWAFRRVILALVFCASLFAPVNAQQPEEITMIVNGTANVDEAGNGRLQIVMTFSPPRGYDRIKRAYPNLYVLFRDFGPERSNFEVNRETLKITSDDGQRSITFSADVLGAAVSKKNRWQIEVDKEERLSTQDANKVFTSLHRTIQLGLKMTGTQMYLLPQNAQNVSFDKENSLITYTTPHRKVSGDPTIDVAVRYKRRVMSALYKLYSDSEAEAGAYWVGKTIVKNTGTVPIYDLKIHYRLGDYTEANISDQYSFVMPRGTVVDCYYPIIQSRVTQLRTQTPIQLYVKCEYKDASGQTHYQEISKRLELLGVNQFEFSNLNDEDRSDSWFDYFNNAPLLAAFVTKVDEAVKQFAGYVSEAAGGAAAASNDEGAIRWLEAAYNMQLANNIVYQTPSGFVTKDRSSGQEIKFPRDVFRDKSGTCVDLAITYAALAESVGLHANLMVVPGHCFAVVRLPGGRPIPVENTGLGGGDRRLTFAQAVETGAQELQKYFQEGTYYWVDVRQPLTAGQIPNPELPPLAADFLEKSGIKRMHAQGNAVSTNRADSGNTFLLAHDHSGTEFSSLCIGILSVSKDGLRYEAFRSNDGQNHRFELLKTDIKEARKNKLPMGGHQVFHIKLNSGINYNFAHISDKGLDLEPDAVLIEIYRASGSR